MSATSERFIPPPIQLGVAKCCREWLVPVGTGRSGRCGICNEVPRFLHMLPEEEWINAVATED